MVTLCSNLLFNTSYHISEFLFHFFWSKFFAERGFAQQHITVIGQQFRAFRLRLSFGTNAVNWKFTFITFNQISHAFTCSNKVIYVNKLITYLNSEMKHWWEQSKTKLNQKCNILSTSSLPFIFHWNFQSENGGIIDNIFICLQLMI